MLQEGALCWYRLMGRTLHHELGRGRGSASFRHSVSAKERCDVSLLSSPPTLWSGRQAAATLLSTATLLKTLESRLVDSHLFVTNQETPQSTVSLEVGCRTTDITTVVVVVVVCAYIDAWNPPLFVPPLV